MNVPSLALVQQLEDVFKDVRPFKSSNTEKIEEIRESMLEAGFNAPFSGILQRTMTEAEGMEDEEWADLKKQVSYFKDIANLKKYSLVRASIALSAHRLAGHFLKMGYADIAEHTPLEGNHIGLLMDSGAEGIIAYRSMMDKFKSMSENVGCFSVKVRINGKLHTVKLESKERMDYQVARMFGLEAEIVETKPGVKKKPIISSKGTRIALISAVVNYVSKGVEREMAEEESGEVKKYNDFLRGQGLRPDVRIDMVEEFKEIKEELLKMGMLSCEDGAYAMKKELSAQIVKRKKERRAKVMERTTMLVLAPMLRFYLLTPRESRKKANLYPGMAVVPTNAQIRVFSFMEEIDKGFPATQMLRRKMGLEEQGVRMEGKKMAAAILLSESGKSEEWIAEFLRMTLNEVKNSKGALGSIEQGGRGAEFLQRIKGSGTERKQG